MFFSFGYLSHWDLASAGRCERDSVVSGIAGGMLIIDLIAASWLLIINNAVGSDVLHFNGTFFIMALISLATMVVSSVAKRMARV